MTLYHLIALLAAPVAGWLYASWRWPKPIWNEVVGAGIVATLGMLSYLLSGKPPFLFYAGVSLCLTIPMIFYWLINRNHLISRLQLPNQGQ